MYISNGKFVYNDVYELTYALLNAMELSTRLDGAVVDKTIDPTGTVIMVSDKILKANTNARNIHYAGEAEIILNPLVNLSILNDLLGLYLDKYKRDNGMDILSFFSDEIKDENNDLMSRHAARFVDGSTVYSEYYYNRCLGIIDLIFILSEENVYVRNFDMSPTEMEKIRKKEQRELAKQQKEAQAGIIIKKISEGIIVDKKDK